MTKNRRNKNKRTVTGKSAGINQKVIAQAEKDGLIRGGSGFRDVVIHDHTRHRYFSDPGKMPRVRGKNGKTVDVEPFVKRRQTCGPVEAHLTLRSIAHTLDRDTIVKIVSESNEFVANPEMALAVSRMLMEDGLMTREMVDEVLNIQHPAWSQLSWKEDDELQSDFVTAYLADPENRGKTEADAVEAFEALPTRLLRKEGEVTVSITTKGGKETYKMHLACEKAEMDRGRYFLALAKDCSPFRSAWLKLHGWRNKPRQIEGRAKDHRQVGKTVPQYMKDAPTLTLGMAVKSQGIEDGDGLMAALQSGKTITL